MLDHVSLPVADIGRAKAFYAQALAPLDYMLVLDFDQAVGFGVGGKPDFWPVQSGSVGGPIHVAFQAKDRAAVRAFHAAALKAGGRDNGAPGLRSEYHPTYYGAFVLDPDGHNIEAVCHLPE